MGSGALPSARVPPRGVSPGGGPAERGHARKAVKFLPPTTWASSTVRATLRCRSKAKPGRLAQTDRLGPCRVSADAGP
eukprot:2248140-Alexandrium_andersonii.AAC.1